MARTEFLKGLSAFDSAVADPLVVSVGSPSDFVRRGLAVAVFNLLETFVAERFAELAQHVNGGHLAFTDLPSGLQKRAIRNVLEVAAAQVKHVAATDLPGFAAPVGKSLVATSGVVDLAATTWAWSGSNMSDETLHAALRSLHVSDPYASMRVISGHLRYPTSDASGGVLNLRTELQDFAAERHRSAHDSHHTVTSLWLRATSDVALKFASTFDALASASCHLLRSRDAGFLTDDKYVNDVRIKIRSVEQRATDFAEWPPGARRVYRVSADGDQLFRDASRRCGTDEFLVRFNAFNRLVDWSYPVVG